MALYEHILIARQDVSQQQVEALVEQLTAILKENGGSVTKNEYWGLRNLSFKVKKNRKGHYALMNIDAPHAAVAEMERQMGLNEDVLRFLTIRVEEHEEGQSAMLQNRGGGREERGGERGGGGGRFDRGDRPRSFDRGDRGDRPRFPRGDDAPAGDNA
ncbi:MAG: 30S ribosomal protein S6 [Parvibaculum sp.]|uniref:30S ribosomal protein S6 n=1 Tax=Parvibaculum sp. TaxID=2024848 RepID=UPI0026002F2B|nr:30S ribosomal protein S6 [Parvibaculum sp.]MCE9651078.1 30S ribosomal protein S6 [Parvibaculum sp.]